MSFRDTKDLDTEVRINKTERKATRLVPEKGTFKEIEVGAGSITFKMDRRGIWMGAADYDDAIFRVSMGGVMRMRANIGSNEFIGIDPTKGIWLGAEEFEDAPFSVALSGKMRLKASPETAEMSMEWEDEEGNLGIYLGFEDIT
jgi:hypothetical protein